MKFFVEVNGKRKSIDTSFDKRSIAPWQNKNRSMGGAIFCMNETNFGFVYPDTVPDMLVDAVLDSLWVKALEALVQIKVCSIGTVKTKYGTLRADVGGDPDYPEIFTYLERNDGVEIDLVAAEIKDSGATAFLYGDTSKEEYTKTYGWSGDDLEIEV